MCLTQYTAMPCNNYFSGTCPFIQLDFCSWHAAPAPSGAVADICVCEGSQPSSWGLFHFRWGCVTQPLHKSFPGHITVT